MKYLVECGGIEILNGDDTSVCGQKLTLSKRPSGSYICAICSFDAKTYNNLMFHCNQEHGGKIHKCPFCSATFRAKKAMSEHQFKRHDVMPPNSRQIYRCAAAPGCQYATTLPASIYTHCIGVHKMAGDCIYTCDKCSQTFQERRALSDHELKEHAGSSQCNICGQVFVRPYNLEMHMKNKHTASLEERKKLLCEFCELKFVMPHHLKRHIDTVHKKLYKQKKYPQKNKYVRKTTRAPPSFGRKDCEKCGKTFKCPFNLTRHIKAVHQEIREYRCRLCDKWFSNAGNLQEHIAVKHMGLKAKDFRQNSEATRHLTLAHEAYEHNPCQVIVESAGHANIVVL